MSDDGPLPLARRRLGDAVHSLADPIPVWHDGACRWEGSLYGRLRAELAGAAVLGRRRAHGSRLPCHGGILALLVEVDRAVAGWEPDGKSTVDRLHQLAGRAFRPQDCELIDGYCDDLARWTVAATELLTPEARVFLPMPCPRCSAKYAYRDNASGEYVRSRALRVSETGARCLACGAFWAPTEFHWLARLLGCDPLPSAG